jgi:hypothetical protein
VCKWDTTTLVKVTVPAHLSHTGKERVKMAGVDSCIAPIVKALNDGEILTDASCCGHGKMFGSIILADGRELLISPDRETTLKYEKILIENNLIKPIN